MIVRVENRRLFIGLLAALIVLAWLGLWIWGQSPYGRFLDHTELSLVSGYDAGLLVFFVTGWTLMVFAMMLPTSLPLIALFQTMTRDRADHKLLVGLLIAGYVGVWAWFGVARYTWATWRSIELPGKASGSAAITGSWAPVSW